jgi:hypothetical protein
MTTETVASLNSQILAKRKEINELATASGLHEQLQAELEDLVSRRNALLNGREIHSPAVDKQPAEGVR